MKATLILTLLLLLANVVQAQDLIVTHQGDSINCKITKLQRDHIYFTFKYKDEIRNTLLPVSGVKEHRFNFYEEPEVLAGQVTQIVNYHRYRLAFNGGLGYHTAKIGDGVPAEFRNYANELKSGYQLGADVTYFFNEPIGAGLKVGLFKSSNSLGNIYRDNPDGSRSYGVMSDDVSILFLGPAFMTRILSHDRRNAFLMNMALGYMGYSNDKVVVDKYKITSSTMGLIFDLGYDFGLSENLSLGVQVSMTTGVLMSYDLSDGFRKEKITLEKDEYESLNRIDLSIGLRFGQ